MYPKSRYFHIIDKSAFKPILRTQYSFDPTKEIELLYVSYSIPFPRSKLRAYSSLLSQLANPDKELKVPAPSDDVFFAFHGFVLDRDYAPKLSQTASTYVGNKRSKGPPTILRYDPKQKSHLLIDIGAFILGCQMKFDELKEKARERMYAMDVIQENPIAALEAVYSAKGIDSGDRNELRKWARKFLRKCHSETEKITEKMNASIISKGNGQWAADFEKLQKAHPLLDKDYKAVFEIELLSRVLETIKLGTTTDVDKNNKEAVELRKSLVEIAQFLDYVVTNAMEDPTILTDNKHGRNPHLGAAVSRFNYGLNRDYFAKPPNPLGPSMKGDIALSKAEVDYLSYYFPHIAEHWKMVVEEQEKVKGDIERKNKEKKEKGEKAKKEQQEKEKKEKAEKKEKKKKKKKEEKEKKEREDKEKKQKEERERKENEERERHRSVECIDGGRHTCRYCYCWDLVCADDGYPCVLCHPGFIHLRTQPGWLHSLFLREGSL